MLLPLNLLVSILVGLISLGLAAIGLYALVRAVRNYRRYRVPRIVTENRALKGAPEAGVQRTATNQIPTITAVLTTRAVMLPLTLGLMLSLPGVGMGRLLVQYAFPQGSDEPRAMRNGFIHYVKGAGNSTLRVEVYGRSGGQRLLFTHGWGMDSTEWYYAKRNLSDQFELILWDLPGLGYSSQPSDRDYSLEKLAQDLHAVIAASNGKPVILVGHSIGGMINLTFCRLYPEMLGHDVAGMIQVDTSYTNPVKTTKDNKLSQALQKPLAEPILYGMIGLSPLVRVMNWMSYENGTSYLMNAKSAFAGAETRGQIDMVSRLQAEASPAVVARGTLAMFHWDATPVLAHITMPVLLLVGQQDTTTLPWASEHMKETMPQAKLVVIDPAAHYSLLEQHQRVNTEIRQFGSELATSR